MLLARVELVVPLKHMKTPSEANACGGKCLRDARRGARDFHGAVLAALEGSVFGSDSNRRKKPVGNCLTRRLFRRIIALTVCCFDKPTPWAPPGGNVYANSYALAEPAAPHERDRRLFGAGNPVRREILMRLRRGRVQ